MKSKVPKAGSSKPKQRKLSQTKTKSIQIETTIGGDVQGVVLSGSHQGALRIDNRKITAKNYIEGGQGNRIFEGASIEDASQLFAMLKQRAEEIVPIEEREDAKNAIGQLEAEAAKGEKADESRVQKWMNFLADTAPDIWEVAVDTLINPVKGVSTVFRKIAERARAEKPAQ